MILLLFTLMTVFQAYLIRKYKRLNKDEMSYVATLTHDLKSPTRALINMLNLLLKGQFGTLNPKQCEMLKLTYSSAKYMSNLVGIVLSGYRYGFNSVLPNKSDIDLVSLVNSVIEQNRLLIAEKGLNVLFNHNLPECIIKGDRLQIERVIENLLSNALIYSFENTDILFNLTCNAGFTDFSVSNKSYYIEPKELKNIFKKFSASVNSQLNSTSTGLGLFTAKRIITLHGGIMYAQSTPDGVCTFGFRLALELQRTKTAEK